MANIILKILDKDGTVLLQAHGENEVNLVYRAEYQEGDSITLEVDETDAFYYVQFDDAKGKSLVYLTGTVNYVIPFGEKSINTSPKVFAGDDGSKEVLDLVKGGHAQIFDIHKENLEWLEISELIKADDPSPFPALIQLQVYGRG